MNLLRASMMSALLSLSAGVNGQNAAPSASPMRISGTIAAMEGRMMTVKTAEGNGKVSLPADVRLSSSRKASLKDIGPNTFVGTTAVKKGDGKLYSTEVHIFAESLRGLGEGHRPMAAVDTTMTNGSVATMTNGSVQKQGSANGEVVLRVSYKGGEQEVHVGPDVPITMIEVADFAQLKPGAKVTSYVRPQADGTAVAQIVTIDAMP